MRQLLSYSFICFSVLIFISSCKLDSTGDCYAEAPALPVSVDAPSTGMLNQPININVQFQIGNGCGSFLRNDSYTDGDTTEVVIRAKYQGCVCTQQIVGGQQTFQYTPTRTGAHYFRYFISEGVYLKDTIWVQ